MLWLYEIQQVHSYPTLALNPHLRFSFILLTQISAGYLASLKCLSGEKQRAFLMLWFPFLMGKYTIFGIVLSNKKTFCSKKAPDIMNSSKFLTTSRGKKSFLRPNKMAE